jgi:hypothetical protein
MSGSIRSSWVVVLALIFIPFLSQPALAACDAHQKDCIKGTPEIFVFVNDDYDRKSQDGYVPDKLMDFAIDSANRVFRDQLAHAIPTSHLHFVKSGDIASGRFTRELESVALWSKDSPIDLINLTHGGPDGWIDAPKYDPKSSDWDETVDDRIFARIPAEARKHLRLFFNAACFGESAKDWAIKRGFVAMVGAPGVSLGPLVVEEFTKEYAEGKSLEEIAQNIYSKCLRDRSWAIPAKAGEYESDNGDTRESYCTKDAALTIVGAEDGVSRFTIDTPVAAHEPMQPDVLQELHWEPMPKSIAGVQPDISEAKPNCIADTHGNVFAEHMLFLKQGKDILDALEFNESDLSPTLTARFNANHPLIPNKVTVTPKGITQLDWTGVKLMGVSVGYIRRDTRKNTKWEAGLVKLKVPVLTKSFGGKTLHGTVTVSGLSDLGYKATSFKDEQGRDQRGFSATIAPELDSRLVLLRRAYLQTSNTVELSNLAGRKTYNTYEAGVRLSRSVKAMASYNTGTGFDRKRLDIGFSIHR